jgi:hypothetical protein
MAVLSIRDIKALGRAMVLQHPEGVRFTEIVNHILALHPEAVRNTVTTQIGTGLVASYPTEISKPSRGLYVPLLSATSGDPATAVLTASTASVAPPAAPSRREEEFYEPFAAFLQNDLDEANIAVAMGGAAFKDKWGTPDVVGVYRQLTSDFIPFAPEIITAEIKIDASQSVVAFGQAVAYRLFATRSYIVMPSSMTPADQSRLEALCILFGLGFVVFDASNPNDPRFLIRVRAQRFVPDAFYANEFARRLHSAYPDRFHQLFQ